MRSWLHVDLLPAASEYATRGLTSRERSAGSRIRSWRVVRSTAGRGGRPRARWRPVTH